MPRIALYLLVIAAKVFLFEALPPLLYKTQDDGYKETLIAAMNKQRKAFGFDGEFKLGQASDLTDETLQKAIREIDTRGMRRVAQYGIERGSNPELLPYRPLYLDLEFKTETDRDKTKEDDIVAFWAACNSPKKIPRLEKKDAGQYFVGAEKVDYSCEGAWPFITSAADQAVIIERQMDAFKLDIEYLVLFPSYDSVKVDADKREDVAKTVTLKVCQPVDDAEKQKLCTAPKKDGYAAYATAISRLTKCVFNQFVGFGQKIDAREWFVTKTCSDDSLFKKKNLQKPPFRQALDAKDSPLAELNLAALAKLPANGKPKSQ